jgi:hypothetical protein
MSGFSTITIPVTTTGTAGSATGTATSSEVVMGYLVDVFLDFHASAPATTDTTIAFATRGGDILVATNTNTDTLFHPRVKTVDNTGAAITNSHDRVLLNQPITVSVAGCDALTNAVTAYVRVFRP